MRNRWWWAAGAVIALGCTEVAPTEPAADLSAAKGGVPAAGAQRIVAMQQNLFVGFNIDALIEALVAGTPEQQLAALMTAYGEMMRTDFPARAAQIVDEIARARPEVVALQEVSEIHLVAGPIDYHMDFEQEVRDALANRGLDYGIYFVTNIDLDVGAPLGITAALVDRDALLVRGDLAVTNSGFGNYTLCLGTGLSTCIGGLPFPILRGYVWADVALNGQTVRVVSTHLESGTSAPVRYVRAAQAAELMMILSAVSTPVIVMGDLNEEKGGAPNPSILPPLLPDLPSTYEILMAGGFTDTWAAMRPGVRGLTCCNLPDLSNRLPGYYERIDYVLLRGFAWPSGNPQGKISVMASTPAGTFPNTLGLPIWPSDHAGLMAQLLFPAALGN